MPCDCDGQSAAIRHVHVHRQETVNADSIEIGTPSKGGAVKVYLNSADPEAAVKKLDAAFALRQYAEDLATGKRQIAKIEILAPGIQVKLENRNGETEVLQG